MRKQLQAEHGKADLEKKIEELENKKTKLENKVVELRSKIEAIEEKETEKEEKSILRKEIKEIEFLKYQEQHLSKFLKSINDSGK